MERPPEETHPSFGWAQANVVQSTGTHLFDSEVKHHHYVILRIGQAVRSRDLNRDWIRGATMRGEIVEVAMSMAQWGALVSSFGSSGVPVTIERLSDETVEPAEHEPRLALSVAEVEDSVNRLMEKVKAQERKIAEAFDRKAGRREMGELLRTLGFMVANAGANAGHAANTLTEHVENVITKARYDIEATARMAAERGLDAGDATLLLGPEATERTARNADEG